MAAKHLNRLLGSMAIAGLMIALAHPVIAQTSGSGTTLYQTGTSVNVDQPSSNLQLSRDELAEDTHHDQIEEELDSEGRGVDINHELRLKQLEAAQTPYKPQHIADENQQYDDRKKELAQKKAIENARHQQALAALMAAAKSLIGGAASALGNAASGGSGSPSGSAPQPDSAGNNNNPGGAPNNPAPGGGSPGNPNASGGSTNRPAPANGGGGNAQGGGQYYPGGNPGGVPSGSSPPQTGGGLPATGGNQTNGGPPGGGANGGKVGNVPSPAAPENAPPNPGNSSGPGLLKGANDIINDVANKMAPPPSTGTGQPYTGPLAINGHSPGYYLNAAVNKIVDSIPGGSGNLQQANQAATQFVNNNFRDQWTKQMTPQEAAVQVGGAFGGAVVGKGLGAAGGALRQALAARSGVGSAISKALAAGVQAGKEEAQSFSGIGGSANGLTPAEANGQENGQTPTNGAAASGTTPPGENPVTPGPPAEPAAGTTQPPPPLTGAAAVKQMADEFDSQFGTSTASQTGAGADFGNPDGPACAKNACFPTALAQAELWRHPEDLGTLPAGTRINGLRADGSPDMTMAPEDVTRELEQRFGGTAAANNPVYTPEEIMSQQQGTPIPVSPARLQQILNSGQNGSQWLIFIKHINGDGHVFNARTTSNGTQFLDNPNKMDGGRWLSRRLRNVFAYQIY